MPLPLSELPQAMRERIELAAAAAEPPPKYITFCVDGRPLAQIASRAYYEWWLRRGRDILASPIREKIGASLRAEVIARDGLVCQLCGGSVRADDVHIDHRLAVSRGGLTNIENLQVAHAKCNLEKGAGRGLD